MMRLSDRLFPEAIGQAIREVPDKPAPEERRLATCAGRARTCISLPGSAREEPDLPGAPEEQKRHAERYVATIVSLTE